MPKHPVRIVTAASLFDGHDATINIIRRILQDQGAEVIHLGHNRSVSDVVKAVLQEGAQGVCVSSYQGGHIEYFKYMKDLLRENGADYATVWGGGGGVIIHDEKKELEDYGISQVFHPDDGRRLGLEGMIRMIVEGSDFDPVKRAAEAKAAPEASAKKPLQGTGLKNPFEKDPVPSQKLGLALTALENGSAEKSPEAWGLKGFLRQGKTPPVLGITGTGGAGKSSLIDELAQRFLNAYPDKKIGIVCVDPSKRKTGGSLLGDRIRMNSLSRDRIFMRSLASRGSGKEIAQALPQVLDFMKQLDFDLIIAETSGIGQGNMAITEVSDLSMYVMTSDFGAQSQLEKIDMIDFADLIAVNKADRRGAADALRDVSKQYKRSRKLFHEEGEVPVFLTQASQFNDGGVNKLFFKLSDLLDEKVGGFALNADLRSKMLSAEENTIIPPDRQGYLAE
ncbi:MAG TPA: cobalamin-dependent protein, partial [Pseudobdellovibrionaceae bacterium]|nr:cobalamin-dependent protein [Pseudobdellovibrionaceae bacterium]